MSYLLDSNIVIKLLAGEPSMSALASVLAPSGLFVSVITVMEVRHGLVNEGGAALARLDEFLMDAPAIEISYPIAVLCADLRVHLANQGKSTRNRTLDLFIASTAIHLGMVLVTLNNQDFRDIPGLELLR